MKRSHPPISAQAAGAAFALFLVLASLPMTSTAQGDCSDGLLLVSPRDLTIDYQESPVAGNQLSWEITSTDSTACYELNGMDEITEFEVDVQGSYLLDVDRDIDFEVVDRGIVGAPTVERLEVIWSSTNEVQGVISGILNLSNSGGIYNLDLGPGTARQTNAGIPPYLSRTNIRNLSVWADGSGASKIYGVVPGLPVIASSDGGVNWVQTVDSRDDPLLARLSNPNISRALVEVSPTDSNLVFVGTSDGLFRSIDGGASFIRIASELSSGTQEVRLIEYEEVTGRLFLCINGLGLYESTDSGDSWTEFTSLRVPKASADSPDSAQTTRAVVLDIVASPADPNLLFVGLRNWGVYASPDGGITWDRRDENMVLGPSETYPRGRKVVAQTLIIDSRDPNRILAGSASTSSPNGGGASVGLFISVDAGLTWADSVATIPTDASGRTLPLQKLLQNASDPQEFFCSTPSTGILHSVDGGLVWTQWYDEVAQPPLTSDVGDLVWHPTIPDQLLMASEGGGVYERGVALRLSDTINANATDVDLLDTDFGLSVSFDAAASADSNGLMRPGDIFSIRAQTFQGYVVWRAQDLNPDTGEPLWVSLGLYDLSNPEFCFETPCEDTNPLAILGCFADKRANCFDFESEPGRASFFDREVYDGFTYRYAVSTFDYGFTGNTAPSAIARDMSFSPRSAVESSDQAQENIVPGNYNDTSFTVSGVVAPDLSNIWVVPNPLRRDAGWDTGGAASIHFVNVTEGCTAQVYTLAGDLVVELSNYQEQSVDRGVIVWDTLNARGEAVASDVYIWRISNSAGEERIGKLTIIR